MPVTERIETPLRLLADHELRPVRALVDTHNVTRYHGRR